jgi:hypothetical protein
VPDAPMKTKSTTETGDAHGRHIEPADKKTNLAKIALIPPSDAGAKQVLSQTARPADRQNDDLENTPIGQNATKTDLLAAIMGDPDIWKRIGSAWVLYLRLVLIEGGKMVATYEEIGRNMATSGKTVRNWVTSLEDAGIVKSATEGHHISVELLGRHMTVSQAPNSIAHPTKPETTPAIPMTPRQLTALKILQTAESAGSSIELKVIL